MESETSKLLRKIEKNHTKSRYSEFVVAWKLTYDFPRREKNFFLFSKYVNSR